MVEAEVGSLLEFLPIPLVLTSGSGHILRANAEAASFLDSAGPLIGKHVDDVLREQAISFRMRLLVHEERALRLYALQNQSAEVLFGGH